MIHRAVLVVTLSAGCVCAAALGVVVLNRIVESVDRAGRGEV